MKEGKLIFLQVIKKFHLLALPPLIIVFIIIGIYLLRGKFLIFPIVIFTFLPAFLYGKLWAKEIIKIKKQDSISYRFPIFFTPIFVFFYLAIISFILSFLINRDINFIQHVYIILESICSFYIFYSISVLITLIVKTKNKLKS